MAWKGARLACLVFLSGLGTLTEATESLAQCPANAEYLGSDCNGIGYEGCCSDSGTLVWCEANSALCKIDCSQNLDAQYQRCGWSVQWGFYRCGALLATDPSCAHPWNCPGNCQPCGELAFEGCCDGALVKWCECGCIRSIDCSGNTAPNNVCGWKGDEGLYDCGGNGEDPSGANPLQCQDAPCVPDCSGKDCGPDGCGGTCGTCPEGQACDAATSKCVDECVPDCNGKECGSDGCGGTCGQCPQGQVCSDFQCIQEQKGCGADPSQTCKDSCGWIGVGGCWCDDSCSQFGNCCPDYGDCCPKNQCTPDCFLKECGDDGCGGSCGSCQAGAVCQEGLCVQVGPVGCGADQSQTCQGNCGYKGTGGCWCDQSCVSAGDCCPDYQDCCQDNQCIPDCGSKECGDDGCGGSCGACPVGKSCDLTGHCVGGGCMPNCVGKQCGDDGCGGSCGACPPGYKCEANQCASTGCIPDCAGKQCGDDGCGGICGACASGQVCVDGTCEESHVCVPDCTGKECGGDGCGGTCGVCIPPKKCGQDFKCYDPNNCQRDCTGRECGSDGCGGLCGTCPQGQVCDAQGQCALEQEMGDGAISAEGLGPRDASFGQGCPEGTVSMYGQCVSTGKSSDEQGRAGGGCAATPRARGPMPVVLLIIAVLGSLGFLRGLSDCR